MEAEFTIEYGALTAAEQDAFVALLNERTAHANEVLEARGRQPILQALLDLLVSSAPPGTTLGEARSSPATLA